jgi:Zn-dependent protease
LVAWLAKLLSIAFSLNLLLFAFNLLPLPSLDGSSLPLLFLRGRAAQGYLAFLWNPTFRFIGLLLAWRGFGYVFEPIRRIAMRALYHGAG